MRAIVPEKSTGSCSTTPMCRRSCCWRHVAHVHAVEQDLPLLHVVEAAEQADDARLARAGRADDGDARARRDLEAHVLQHRLVRVVGEVDVAELDVAAHLPQRLRVGAGRRTGRLLVQQHEHALGGGHRRLHDVVLLGQVADRLEGAVGVLEEGHQHAQA